jgi:ribose-phosphate pyrophosphokinase
VIARAPLLFPLPGNETMAERLALALDAEVGEVTMRDFPDGETYVRLLTDPAGRQVGIVGTLARPNDKILPLLFLAGAARQLGAARTGIIAAYLAYMRQDARFHPGEAITARLFADVISRAADWLITIDPHLHRIAELDTIYRVPATAVHVAELLGAWIVGNVSQPLIIGPDEESRQWVSGVAAAASAPFVVLSKVRKGDEDVDISLPDLTAYHGYTPVLVDDIISSGHTMLAALRQLRRATAAGAPPVCVAVHALFDAGVHDRLVAAGAARIVTTNTIPHTSNGIDVVPALATALRDQFAAAADRGGASNERAP